MASFRIVGGNRLHGEVIPQGAKNEALQVICAALLTEEPVTIHNVPDIRDVNALIDLMKSLGVEIERLGPESYRFTAKDIRLEYLETSDFREKAATLRGSIMIIGPLLARFGRAKIFRPGGDKIGRRRLDTHFFGFQRLGASFFFEEKT